MYTPLMCVHIYIINVSIGIYKGTFETTIRIVNIINVCVCSTSIYRLGGTNCLVLLVLIYRFVEQVRNI